MRNLTHKKSYQWGGKKQKEKKKKRKNKKTRATRKIEKNSYKAKSHTIIFVQQKKKVYTK